MLACNVCVYYRNLKTSHRGKFSCVLMAPPQSDRQWQSSGVGPESRTSKAFLLLKLLTSRIGSLMNLLLKESFAWLTVLFHTPDAFAMLWKNPHESPPYKWHQPKLIYKWRKTILNVLIECNHNLIPVCSSGGHSKLAFMGFLLEFGRPQCAKLHTTTAAFFHAFVWSFLTHYKRRVAAVERIA